MTDQQHPITPPPELVEEWAHMLEQHTDTEVFTQAARWGADQELEACCEWVSQWCLWVGSSRPEIGLRDFRRPKPPSLKEQALSELAGAVAGGNITPERGALIRLALEQLDD